MLDVLCARTSLSLYVFLSDFVWYEAVIKGGKAREIYEMFTLQFVCYSVLIW